MLRRLAIVIWWFGAALLALGIYVVAFGDSFMGAFFLCLPALGCLAGAFVLGGSFIRPPR